MRGGSLRGQLPESLSPVTLRNILLPDIGEQTFLLKNKRMSENNSFWDLEKLREDIEPVVCHAIGMAVTILCIWFFHFLCIGSLFLYDHNPRTQIRLTCMQGAKNFGHLSVKCCRTLTMTRYTQLLQRRGEGPQPHLPEPRPQTSRLENHPGVFRGPARPADRRPFNFDTLDESSDGC